nr:immunoglobulin light chain junction region [Macaca mulatta]
CHQGYRTPYSF